MPVSPHSSAAQSDPHIEPRPVVTDGVSASPVIEEPDETWTVPWLLADRIARLPDAPIIERKTGLGNTWTPVTARAFGQEVARVAAGLMGMGLTKGQSVGLMAHTSYEWTLLDMAIARAGLVSVPIYETDSAEQIEWILQDAEVHLVVTESVALAQVVGQAVEAFHAARPNGQATTYVIFCSSS